MQYRLLQEFENLFKGQPYKHRKSNLGDFVAMHLYEDLYNLAKPSDKLKQHIESHDWVLSTTNKRLGIKARRGDGSFGELVPGEKPVIDPGYHVARGMVATIEIGVETKILMKAMMKQIERVSSDLQRQSSIFKSRASVSPITVALVGINQAPYTVGYEGKDPETGKDRRYKTDGTATYKHPIDEAKKAEQYLIQAEETNPQFFEFVILNFSATNDDPFEFKWANEKATEQRYAAALLRICREYEKRF